MTRAAFEEYLGGLQRRGLRCAIAGTVLLAVGLIFASTKSLLGSYLIAWLFVLGLGLGSLGLTLLAGLTGGAWGRAIRPVLDAGMSTLPFLAVGFLPIAFGVGTLYEWADPEVVAGDKILQQKAPYLNVPFFLIRAAIYFALWIGFSQYFLRGFARYAKTRDPRILRRMREFCGPGILIYVVTMTFASVDWGMSLEPHWFSSMYGVIFIMGQVLSVLCLAIFTAAIGQHYEPFKSWLEPKHFHDLGNLVLAFVMLWAYVSFSQYLIQWSGNLHEETPYYLMRTHEGWQVVAILLIILHFAVPFAVLLSRKTKRMGVNLARIAGLIMVMRVVDIFWQIAPALRHHGFAVTLWDIAALMALGGAWFAFFGHSFRIPDVSPLAQTRILHRDELKGIASQEGAGS